MLKLTAIAHARRPIRGGGFTLVEMVAVLVLVAIIAVVAVPSVNSFGDTRAAMAARQLQRDLTFARQRAIATGTKTWVSFNLPENAWTLLTEDPENPGRKTAAVLTDFATGRPIEQTLGEGSYIGVELAAVAIDGGSEIGFNWQGQPINAAETPLNSSGAVTLTGNHVVTIEPGTGLAIYVAP